MLVALAGGVSLYAQSADARNLYDSAVSADERGDTAEAIRLYQQYLKAEPQSVPALANLGVALAHIGRYNEAMSKYRNALKIDPNNETVRLNLALAWYKQAEFDKAALELVDLRKSHPGNPQALFLLADCYLRLDKNREAIALLQPAYEANPEDRAVDYALGTALLRAGEIHRGEAVINHIVKDGDTAEANLLLGEAQVAAGDHRAAAKALQKAVRLNPDLSTGWSLYGRVLLDNDDLQNAKEAFRHALKLDHSDFDANIHLGAILRREGNATEAEPYLQEAVRLRPNSAAARFQMAALHVSLGKLEQGRRELESLEKEWPDFQEVHVQLASLYARLKLTLQSERERQVILKLNTKAREGEGPGKD
jgi:tetratricopeptide (TPR) repeat protein